MFVFVPVRATDRVHSCSEEERERERERGGRGKGRGRKGFSEKQSFGTF
jgi:hypothetical protein